MKEANGDHKLAKAYYSPYVPEEPVSKWKTFATRMWQDLQGGAQSLASLGRGEKPGPYPHISDELAIKIGTVYSQRLHWEHGQARHYHDMAEACRLHPILKALCAQPGITPTHIEARLKEEDPGYVCVPVPTKSRFSDGEKAGGVHRCWLFVRYRSDFWYNLVE